MPSTVVVGTPESILPRSDSKNPVTTCRGLTSNGRPCRRSLASSKNANKGIIAMVPHVGEDAAAYFCWQHKDQASNSVDDTAQIFDLQQRSSIDTLMEKLRLSDHQDFKNLTKPKKATARKSSQWSGASVSGSLPSTLGNPFGSGRVATPSSTSHAVTRRKRKEQIHVSFFCCMKNPHDEVLPPARPIQQVEKPLQSRPVSNSYQSSRPTRVSIPYQAPSQSIPATLEEHLSYIPPTLPSTTRTSLMTELSKPPTAADHEPGYIYIFWLTPKDVPVGAAQLASSLLQPPNHTSNVRSSRRRTSDVLLAFSDDGNNSQANAPRTIMLKIGRASNVHRRMIQWSQQCGHHITLLRYYPCHKTSSPLLSPHTSPSSSPRKIPTDRETSPSLIQKSPFIARVERLIHLELAGKRVKRNCEGCGKEHREWFEIEATRKGIREVDDIVRRWIDWAKQQ
ncbi:MAG: hypothetical protein GOMPHAMPRED_007607 [Gomphillus americanus]|uniref:Bacteriophage T5 Orf172 DNA-binding domain-containing protein n=1 Tax=Gomphillus americanus TaxID=1940652 RepID=A0A8H3ET49_9LECA|nr:MAG: hypothetical protein GOMPHAMPRED_007607 [Gomphillus americanus]